MMVPLSGQKRVEEEEEGRSRSRSGGGTATRPEFKSCTYGRSNSFYAEAIADCLEFIRKTSVSVHGMPSLARGESGGGEDRR
ncbi:hypothetical protein HPP92_019153 [Vanilla planifolia]|uniref:Uncharacterized protein n=1 Tax=Vanilla planifolia TaxID=51239 RepID=A0A835Q3J0_VANPL|nr:hypothetical protein HPP92_019153 [Vanilla planifolia]